MALMAAKGYRKQGFSLIELLVVITILAILMAIVIPSLISTQPQRNLAAASERVGLDMKYAMQTAQATGNDVIVGFACEPNPDNIENARAVDGTALTNTYQNGQFVNPGNPGVARTATRYFIVEARKRWRDEVIVGVTSGPNYKRSDEPRYLIPYTYLDWLNLYDAYNDGRVTNPPVEPLFPYAEGLGQPSNGDFNAFATPRFVYPQKMNDTSNTAYLARFLAGTPNWSAGNREDQIYKMFCAADREEILAYDQNPVSYDDNGLRLVGPEDSLKLRDQIIDYVLLKDIELPDHCVLINPTHNSWVTDFENTSAGTVPSYQDMQFLQHLWVFHPSGEVTEAEWGYEDFGDTNTYVHGEVLEHRETPQAHCFWMITDEVAEDIFDGDTSGGSPFNERKAQQDMNGRIFILWPLNGQYEVLDYAPNDYSKGSLETMITGGNLPVVNNDEVSKKRELGYNQNFLTGP
jgi:prepilin-type N-terminal cleavage/methylation domain-containing protein